MQADTRPDADEVRLCALSRMPGTERLRLAIELSEAVRAFAELGEKNRAERGAVLLPPRAERP